MNEMNSCRAAGEEEFWKHIGQSAKVAFHQHLSIYGSRKNYQNTGTTAIIHLLLNKGDKFLPSSTEESISQTQHTKYFHESFQQYQFKASERTRRPSGMVRHWKSCPDQILRGRLPPWMTPHLAQDITISP